ncbi:DUF559 domain-containing protein [Sphingopyxis sp. PET50]|uniref:DUF559 domain-containing protein n=1 Tax=Sphingopyxis sp. PET50 TaxID=2976533 RepID=UPI0028A88E10|nr:DUF559 domain-containing protein [Sphingopyxis sp. PET50]
MREGSGEGLLDKGYKRPTKRSRELRNNATEAERKLWTYISARKLAERALQSAVSHRPLHLRFRVSDREARH